MTPFLLDCHRGVFGNDTHAARFFTQRLPYEPICSRKEDTHSGPAR